MKAGTILKDNHPAIPRVWSLAPVSGMRRFGAKLPEKHFSLQSCLLIYF